ncbi:MAG: addiction module toxin, HicA family [Cytophagales bacterium]|nr:addiction module toxin, HicA family [Cytophagales bacterium]
MPKIPGINHKRAIHAFEKAGFWIARQGKHITMTNGKQTVTIPRANPINAFTMADIVKGSGLTIEEFKKLL